MHVRVNLVKMVALVVQVELICLHVHVDNLGRVLFVLNMYHHVRVTIVPTVVHVMKVLQESLHAFAHLA